MHALQAELLIEAAVSPCLGFRESVCVIAAYQMEDKSVDDVCEWLEDRGYPESVLQSFKGS